MLPATPATSPDSTPPVRQLRELVRLFLVQQRRFAQEADLPAQGRLLVMLQKYGPMTQAEFGRLVGLEKSWVSRAMDRLAQAGWVARQAAEEDRRSIRLSLTPAGEVRAAELDERFSEHAARVFEHIPPAQYAQLEQALAVLTEALRASAAGEEG